MCASFARIVRRQPIRHAASRLLLSLALGAGAATAEQVSALARASIVLTAGRVLIGTEFVEYPAPGAGGVVLEGEWFPRARTEITARGGGASAGRLGIRAQALDSERRGVAILAAGFDGGGGLALAPVEGARRGSVRLLARGLHWLEDVEQKSIEARRPVASDAETSMAGVVATVVPSLADPR